MTKTELIANLDAKTFVDWVGTPELKDPEVYPGSATKRYEVPYAQVVDLQLRFFICTFYVANEGGVGGVERAFYKDIPIEQGRPSALREWFLSVKDANPENYKAGTVWWKSDRHGQIVYSIVNNAGATEYYYVKKPASGNPTPLRITGTAAEISLFLQTLAGSQFQV